MTVKEQSSFYLRWTLDIILVLASFLMSAILSQSWQQLLQRNYMFVLPGLLILAWHLSSKASGFYEDYGLRPLSTQFIKILKLCFIQAMISVSFVFLTKEDLFTRNFIFYNFGFLLLLLSLRQIVFRKIAGYYNDKNLTNLLVVGSGQLSSAFFEALLENPSLGYNPVGFVSQYQAEPEGNMLGALSRLEDIISEKDVAEIVIVMENGENKEFDSIIETANKAGIRVSIVPDYARFLSKKFRLDRIGKFPIIAVRNEPLEEIQWKFTKRLCDLIFSTLAVVLIFSWLFPVLFILQKFLNPGSIFFLQDRIGKGNKTFKCYKFRTMKPSSGNDQYRATEKGDSRINKFGGFLRKSNLDELPQIFNVLKGDMSLVGPRPHAQAFNEAYAEYVDYIRLRHLVKPGITGWAQVNGLRGDVDDEDEQKDRIRRRIDLDLWYIENWSLSLDIEIIMRTIWQMIIGNTKGH